MTYAYTDGSTFGPQPAPISWAVVFVKDGVMVDERIGAGPLGSNNRAELHGVIMALEDDRFDEMTVVSDSKLTILACLSVYTPQANLDLWDRYDVAITRREARGAATHYLHVKGHTTPTGDRWDPIHSLHNRRADKLAAEAGKLAHGTEAA
jgi:ribonuclease HI